MSRRLLIHIFSLFLLSAESQNWDSLVGGQLMNGFPEGLFFDSIHNELIVSSKYIYKVGNLPTRGIARWNGNKWDSLKGGINTHSIPTDPTIPWGTVFDGIPYNGKLLVGGMFNSMGGIKATTLALWDGINWDTLPKRGFEYGKTGIVTGLCKYNNIVYLYGRFDTIAAQFTKNIATWDGNNFQSIVLPVNNNNGIYSVKMYKNELYVAGFFYHTSMTDPKNHILKYDGTNWVSVGGGISGTVSRVYDMAIYNNELYVAGRFFKSDGNSGEHIQKWDGLQWHDVGFGGEPSGSVWKLKVFHNKLWAVGPFGYATNNLPATSVAVYDGIKWCVPKDSLDNAVGVIAEYRDTLFIGGGFNTASGTPMKHLAKLKDENLFKQCDAVGILDYSSNQQLRIYPNPVSNTLHVSSEQYFKTDTEIEIKNCLGQIVLKLPYRNEIDVSQLSSGCYVFKIIGSDLQQFYSKFIKE